MSDSLWIFITTSVLIWCVAGLLIAVYLTSPARYFFPERDLVKIQICWPFYLAKLPGLLRERKQNEQARMSRLAKLKKNPNFNSTNPFQ